VGLILGLKGGKGQHNSCLTLLDPNSNEIIFSGEEDRFNGDKQTDCFPIGCLNAAFEQHNISPEDIEYIGITGITDSIIYDYADFFQQQYKQNKKETFKDVYNKIVLNNVPLIYRKKFLKEHFPWATIIDIEHHATHAAVAYYCSDFDLAAIMTVDGLGEFESATYSLGKQNKIFKFDNVEYPHSLGFFYTSICGFLGFDGPNPEGKIMALAAYGKPVYLDFMKTLIRRTKPLKFEFNLDEYLLHADGGPLTADSNRFESELGFNVRKIDDPLEQHHYDLAASVQKHFENIIIEVCNDLYNISKVENICVGGGSFLNSVVNNMILDHTQFKNLYVNPGSSDSGNSLGAALYIKHHILNSNKKTFFKNAYLGYDIRDPILACKSNKVIYTEPKELHKDVAKLLSEGYIIGWAQGRTELGPRALCSRSILASPTDPGMKDKLNSKIKFREWFRPFAPVVMEEHASTYFDLKTPSPYMLLVCNIKDEWINKLPAISHIDNTARVQTLNEEQNPSAYKLLEEFHKLTNIHVLLNTSFNIGGESIVNNEKDAIRCFLYSDLDYLVLGNLLISKEDNKEQSANVKQMTRDGYYTSRLGDYQIEFKNLISNMKTFFSSREDWIKAELIKKENKNEI